MKPTKNKQTLAITTTIAVVIANELNQNQFDST